ncbi:hypothetical protein ONZ45_g1626 [Pleurotus djamor]|nr:hypothetical protein ONZ45_g1626 [Pleurotus djamor]
MYTASSVFLETLAEAGITHAFVNWGSDHPGLLEDLERQRVEGNGDTKPCIVTCPNEMVALSAAQGYAQVSGRPAAVIVHVDVGTQAMAGAIHNVDRGRTPVLIYAGASPFSMHDEHRGTRNEFIMWLQDVPDQAAIVRQYMRSTTQLHSGKDISGVVQRSLQIATSHPQGPVYLWARREVMEEPIERNTVPSPRRKRWPPVSPPALSPDVVSVISAALLSARKPLIITSYLGRNPAAVPVLIELSTLLSIPVAISCPSAVNVPFSFPNSQHPTYLQPGTHHPDLPNADVVIVIDSDTPWIPNNDAPSPEARLFVLDGGDVLKRSFGYSDFSDAEIICIADAEVALKQIIKGVKELDGGDKTVIGSQAVLERAQELQDRHTKWVERLNEPEIVWLPPSLDGSPSVRVPNILGILRKTIHELTPSQGKNTLILNEAISNYRPVWEHMRSESAGSHLTSGASSLGWSLGAAIGAILADRVDGRERDLIVVIVGDGSFMFSVPSAAYWIAQKQNTPFLTVVLNNGGWRSPKLSMLGVHPSGHGSRVAATGDDRLSTGFGPVCPDYAQIAVAASGGWAWGKKIGLAQSCLKAAVENAVTEAVKAVIEEKRCAVLDCVVESLSTF